MKFLVDAHLPPRLCVVFRSAGHEAMHTGQLKAQNQTPDETINELSSMEQWVVVTKDADFYHSHLLHGKPWKLLLVRTGNISTRELIALLERHLPAVVVAFKGNSLVELDRRAVQIVL